MNRESRVDARSDDLTADTPQRDFREPTSREEAGHVVLEDIEIREPLIQQVCGRERTDGLADLLEVLAATPGLDHDLFDALESFLVQRRSLLIGLGRLDRIRGLDRLGLRRRWTDAPCRRHCRRDPCKQEKHRQSL